MTYTVDRIPGGIRIDPDAGGQERRQRKEKQAPRTSHGDSVTISEEAKRRSSHDEDAEPVGGVESD